MTSPLITELRQLLASNVYLKDVSIHVDSGEILVETVKGSLYEKTVQQVRDNFKVPASYPHEVDSWDYASVKNIQPATTEFALCCAVCGSTEGHTFCMECGTALPC